MITEKYCRSCCRNKPLEEFRVFRKSKDGYSSWCIKCLNRQERRRKARLGPLPEFKGKCHLCDNPLAIEKSNIDHCHTTLKIRGILYTSCNVGLGMFKDNIHLLYKAIVYLQK